jgi:spermidine/putrescine transport system substrate-binding protein
MKTTLKLLMAGVALLATTGLAQAEGVLNIFNWGNYTNPEVIKKFEETHKVKVTITDYDSNDTALAKVRAGGHGFDMVVPSGNFMPIWISEGLLLETRPDQMENFKNVDPAWVNVPYDPGRHYSVPWQWGTVGVVVNTKAYKGDINTWGIVFNPPDELKGKVNLVPEMNDVIDAAIKYNGGTHCTTDKEVLKKVRDTLLNAKPHWVSMEYSTIDKMVKGDFLATSDWNGSAMRQRLQNPDIKYGYPKEGFQTWMDNLVVLKDAKNVENAKLFQNFIMDPENAAGLSAFARYSTGIMGSDKYLPADMKDAPELTIPKEMEGHYEFSTACPPEATEIYTKIWTEVLK